MRTYPGILAILLVLLPSCNRQYDARLTDIETYINDRPDSALAVVTAIDPADLHTRRDKALHSLVYSMALDKCYIDTTDVTVVQPAFDYFRHHGSADYRLKAVYYRARIAENAGDIDLAKEILVRYGDKYIDKAEDLSFAGKYLMKHCEFSRLVFDFESAIQFAQQAWDKYYECNEARGFATACFALSSSFICIQNYNAAKDILSEIQPIWDSIDDYRKCYYYRAKICIAIYEEDFHDAEMLAEECIRTCSEMQFMPWIDIFDAYVSVGRFEDALKIESLIGDTYEKQQEGHVTTTRAKLHAALGDYQTAYILEQHFVDVIWQEDKRALESDIRFMESQISSEISRVRHRYMIALLTISFILVVLLVCLLLYKLHVRRIQARALIAELESERKELLRISNSALISIETRNLIEERLSLINKVLLEHMSDSVTLKKDNIMEMDRIIGNRQSFVSSIAVLFSICHPGFVSHLRGNGLSDIEIGYCCLLAQGLSGKEISSIFSLPRFYNSASEIRAKLGLSQRETNLNVYLKGLLPLDN